MPTSLESMIAKNKPLTYTQVVFALFQNPEGIKVGKHTFKIENTLIKHELLAKTVQINNDFEDSNLFIEILGGMDAADHVIFWKGQKRSWDKRDVVSRVFQAALYLSEATMASPLEYPPRRVYDGFWRVFIANFASDGGMAAAELQNIYESFFGKLKRLTDFKTATNFAKWWTEKRKQESKMCYDGFVEVEPGHVFVFTQYQEVPKKKEIQGVNPGRKGITSAEKNEFHDNFKALLIPEKYWKLYQKRGR